MEATVGLVGAIDQGTSSSRFLVFDSACSEVARHQVEVSQCTPHEGWMEQDPAELLASVRQCLSEVGKTLQSKALQLKGVGITNQRETTILWDKTTGHALHRAIVWCDNRTAGVAQELIGATPTKDKDCLKEQCGLPIHPYFSALKIKWLMSNCEDVRSAVEEGRCLFGTVDTWLMIIIGLTNFTDKHHICRAAIEAVCFQSKEILDAMNQDSELPLKALRVDGGMTCNELVLQLQADLLGIPVVRPETREMTVLGAAIAAGLACGLWRDLAGLPTLNTSVAYPEIGPDERDERYGKWKCAVQRSRHWASPTHKDEERRNSNKRKTTAVFSLGVLTGVVIGAGLAWALTRH